MNNSRKREYERLRKKVYRENKRALVAVEQEGSDGETDYFNLRTKDTEPEEHNADLMETASPVNDHAADEPVDIRGNGMAPYVISDNDLELNFEDDDLSNLIEDNCHLEDEFENEGEETEHPNFDPSFGYQTRSPLYEGSKLTLLNSFILLLTIFFQCQLSIEAFKVVIAVVALHLPEKNLFFKSYHYFKKMIPSNLELVKRNKYCKSCFKVITSVNCSCLNKSYGTFLTFNMSKQIQVMFSRPSFRNFVTHRFHRTKKIDSNIEDIYDGEVYKCLVNSGFLNDPNNISLSWYTDGVPLFKSSKYSVWPLFFIVNELPYAIRYQPQNVIVGGLWYGSSKPNFNTFLYPLHDELVHVENEGVKVGPVENGVKPFVVKVLCGTCDLPARALVLNMVQFNGKYGCHKCLSEGYSHNIEGRQRVWVHPFNENVTKRDLADSYKYSVEAVNCSEPVYGMKGLSLISKFMPNFITYTGIDVMLTVFSGVGKKLLSLLLLPKNACFDFSLSKMAKKIDERLLQIKPPNFVNRLPRSFALHMAYLKSSELKIWLLYYSLPILLDIMPEPYISHYVLLVKSLVLLSSESISYEDIALAEELLTEFVRDFQELYGVRFMTANFHALLHLPDSVRSLGPLWVTSCFPLEDLNGKITRLVHGTRFAESQIWQSFTTLQQLPTLHNSLDDDDARKFVQNLKNKNRNKIFEEVEADIYVIGQCTLVPYVPVLIAEALLDVSVVATKCWTFNRLQKDRMLYTSKSYSLDIGTASYCVDYKCKSHVITTGLINSFVRILTCDCTIICNCQCYHYAIIEPCIKQEINLPHADFVNQIIVQKDYVAVDVKNLKKINYLVCVEDKNYCISAVKNFEFS